MEQKKQSAKIEIEEEIKEEVHPLLHERLKNNNSVFSSFEANNSYLKSMDKKSNGSYT